jgi:hypothetical protein
MRALACVPTQGDVAPMLALLRTASPSPVSPLTVYLLDLAPLVGLTQWRRQLYGEVWPPPYLTCIETLVYYVYIRLYT